MYIERHGNIKIDDDEGESARVGSVMVTERTEDRPETLDAPTRARQAETKLLKPQSLCLSD